MKDADCVGFLQWALPRLHMRWPGFRKVRRQVCRRVQRRISELGLNTSGEYREYLERHPDEWAVLEGLTPITISSFYRDRAVWNFLTDEVLPRLGGRDTQDLRAWSIGCASGEEPCTLQLVWRQCVSPRRPSTNLDIVATDAHIPALNRAQTGCYSAGSLKHLPSGWLERAFEQRGNQYCLREGFRRGIDFRRQDIREELPGETFDLILCRNMVMTYFDESLQRKTLARILSRLRENGVFVLGRREVLPAGDWGLEGREGAQSLGIYWKTP